MAWPWLILAAKTIPWVVIIQRTPHLIHAASSLLATREATQIANHAAKHSETQLSEIGERLTYLEDHDQETAKVVNQIAEQTQDVVSGMQVLAAKIRLLTYVLGATSIVAFVAILVAVP